MVDKKKWEINPSKFELLTEDTPVPSDWCSPDAQAGCKPRGVCEPNTCLPCWPRENKASYQNSKEKMKQIPGGDSELEPNATIPKPKS